MSATTSPAKSAASLPKEKGQEKKGAVDPSTGAKGLSAKELKKAKRAAAVAARGGGGGEGSAASPAPSAAGAAPGSTVAGPTAAGAGGNAGATASGPSRHRRAIAAEKEQAQAAAAMPAQLFFSHLPEHRDPGTPAALASDKIHPVVVRLGVLIASGTLRGASARTIGVLQAFREVVRDYTCPDTAVFWKDLATHISPMIAYLETCRPKGVGVGNAIRWFKGEITHLGEAHDGRAAARAEDMQKAKLMAAIDGYIQDRIVVAGQVIAEQIQEKIKPGSTVAVYARSSVVERALLDAFAHMQAQVPAQSFTVAVIDSRPLEEGRALLGALTAAGIPCTYTLLPLASTMIARASLVLFGASSLNSDGALHSRAGTAVVAMLAKEHRVPVVACVETFKLSERVGLDDLASNELGPEDDVLNIPNARALEITRPIPKHLTPLNLLYDLTPPSHITAVCTEVGFIPPSSVPTLLGKDVMVAA